MKVKLNQVKFAKPNPRLTHQITNSIVEIPDEDLKTEGDIDFAIIEQIEIYADQEVDTIDYDILR